MNSNELKIPKHVAIRAPEKCYFRKYTHKLEFEASAEKKAASMAVSQSWSRRRYNYYNVKSEITNPIKNILSSHETDDKKFDYRLRQESYTVSLYFSDSKILELMLSDPIKGKLTALYKPHNDKHLEFMEVNKKIRVRKTLFNRYYRYKLYVKNTSKFRKDEIMGFRAWLHETYPEKDRIDINSGLSYLFNFSSSPAANKGTAWYRASAVLAIYFNDEVDLMMAKLRLNEHISHIEEAVLLEEL